MKKAFVTIFPLFSEALAYKDVGLIVRYMSEYHGYDGYILSNTKVDLDNDVFSGVKQICLGAEKEQGKIEVDIARYNYIKILNVMSDLSKKYDKVVVNFYHHHSSTLFLLTIIKFLFSNIYIYIKFDVSSETAKTLFRKSNTYKNKIRDTLLGCVDFFSAETNQAFCYLKQLDVIRERIGIIPNGVFLDDGLIDANTSSYINDKEKIIFTAGRLESYQKNTKLLVSSYLSSKLWLDGWQLILAGSYDAELEQYINEQVCNTIGNNSEHIMLTGHLNRKQLFSYMRRAKVFALSSRWEGFALVLPEAVAHGCVIAATDVGGVEDVTNGGKLGFIAKDQSVECFTDALTLAALSDSELGRRQMAFGLANFDWRNICDKLASIFDEKIK